MGDTPAWPSTRIAGGSPSAATRLETMSYGWPHPGHLHFDWTMDLRVIGAQHQLHHQCHQCLRDLEDRGIHAVDQWPHRESRGHMKIILPTFKDEDTKDAITYQSWCWDLTVYHHAWDAGITPFSPMPFVHCKVTQGSWWEAQGWTSPWIMSWPYWMSTATMSRPWKP